MARGALAKAIEWLAHTCQKNGMLYTEHFRDGSRDGGHGGGCTGVAERKVDAIKYQGIQPRVFNLG